MALVAALSGWIVVGILVLTGDDDPLPPPRPGRIASYDVGPAGRTLEVTYGTGCFQTYDVVVENDVAAVDVHVVKTYLPNPDQIACAAVVEFHSERVTLPEALGDRDVLSLGQPVPRERR